jgi:hypothetical protein
MPQLHLYVSEDLAGKIREQAEASGSSVSGYLADLVRREVPQGWPEGFFERVVGGWQGPPPERPVDGGFEERESL